MSISEAKRRANKKYDAKSLDMISVKVRKDGPTCKENLQKWAKNAGTSVNKYVITAIIEKAVRDGELPPTVQGQGVDGVSGAADGTDGADDVRPD